MALRRIADRVRQGGHNVPPADVARRFQQGWANFQRTYRALADSWAVYDNTTEALCLIEQGPWTQSTSLKPTTKLAKAASKALKRAQKRAREVARQYGPDTTATREVIEAYQKDRAAVAQVESAIVRLCAMLRQGGALMSDTVSAKVISGLGSAGVFRLGGVLVGTHAFMAMGNVLGVRWQSGLRTEDIDILASPVLEVAIGQVEADLPATLESLNMGFLPVPGLDAHSAKTSFKVCGKT